MIDKTGNSDTYSKLLSGSGTLEMKSDGLSLGLTAYDWGTAADGRGGNKLISGVDEDDNMPHA